jgi:hypothetical protein
MTSLTQSPTQKPFVMIPMVTPAQTSTGSWITFKTLTNGQLAAWKDLIVTSTESLKSNLYSAWKVLVIQKLLENALKGGSLKHYFCV